MSETFKEYQSHKRILARPMTRGEYNELQGWALPVKENPDDEGYLVMYPDGGNRNHNDYPHYISWSPKDVFDKGNDLLEETTVVPKDMDDFVTMFMPWWEGQIAQLAHMRSIPEGTSVQFEGQPELQLTDGVRQGFIAGLDTALIALGTLPFAVEHQDIEVDAKTH